MESVNFRTRLNLEWPSFLQTLVCTKETVQNAECANQPSYFSYENASGDTAYSVISRKTKMSMTVY